MVSGDWTSTMRAVDWRVLHQPRSLTAVVEVLAARLQLAVQCTGAAAEARVVLVGAVAGSHDQRTVGEKRVVGTAWVHVHTCSRAAGVRRSPKRGRSFRSRGHDRRRTKCGRSVIPRPAGVWLVTRPAGGGPKAPPPVISQTTGPISKFQTPFDSPVRELPVQGHKFDPEVTDDVTGQVKVRIFDFSGLVTSASKISMLSANKVNESAWIMPLTSVSIISCAL